MERRILTYHQEPALCEVIDMLIILAVVIISQCVYKYIHTYVYITTHMYLSIYNVCVYIYKYHDVHLKYT